jgi:hypothetical protein
MCVSISRKIFHKKLEVIRLIKYLDITNKKIFLTNVLAFVFLVLSVQNISSTQGETNGVGQSSEDSDAGVTDPGAVS